MTPKLARIEKRNGHGPRAIGELTSRLVAKPLGKRGFAVAALAGDWAAIAGSALARSTLPIKVTFARGERAQGTLHLRVASGGLAVEVQHLAPLILQRVNGHFGYAAVAHLAITQGPVPRHTPRQPAPVAPEGKLDPDRARAVAALPDEALRKAVDGLGRQLARTWHRS